MKVLELERKVADKKMVRRAALSGDCKRTIDYPCIVKHKGKVIFIYDELKLPTEKLASKLQQVKFSTQPRNGGLISTSRIFGYKPRNPVNAGQDFCSPSTLNDEDPRLFKEIEKVAARIAARYNYHEPKKYKEHKALSKRVLLQWVIKGTPFTSGIVNKNNALKYHYDGGNFKDVFSCMLMLRRDFEGGELCLPEFDCKIKLAHNSLFMFDGQGVIHGVTPIQATSNQSYRFTLVFYSLRNMWSCKTIDEELERVRQRADQR